MRLGPATSPSASDHESRTVTRLVARSSRASRHQWRTSSRGYADVAALEGAGTVRLRWQPATAPCTATVRELDDPMLREVWGQRLTRLELDVTALTPVGTLELIVEELR